MHMAYFSVLIISIIFVYLSMNQHPGQLQQKLALLAMLNVIAALGDEIKLLAHDRAMILMGHQLICMAGIHIVYVMFLFMLEYCNKNIPKWARIVCISVNWLTTLFVVTTDNLGISFRNIEAVEVNIGKNTYLHLTYDYGVGHYITWGIALIYLGLYLYYGITRLVSKESRLSDKQRYTTISLCIAPIAPLAAFVADGVTECPIDIAPFGMAVAEIVFLLVISNGCVCELLGVAKEMLFAESQNGYILFKNNGSIIRVNEIIRQMFPEFREIGGEYKGDIPEYITQVLNGNRNDLIFNDGYYAPEIVPIEYQNEIIGKMIVLEDVTIRRKYAIYTKSKIDHLSKVSNTDNLTGLYNRKYLSEKAGEMLADTHEGTLFIYDMDGFKLINDTYGHQTGDATLIAFANIIKQKLPEAISARVGGDEFMSFIPEYTTEESCNQYATDIIKKLKHYFYDNHIETSTSVSIGIKTCRASNDDFDTLYNAADQLLYKVKNSGKSNFIIG